VSQAIFHNQTDINVSKGASLYASVKEGKRSLQLVPQRRIGDIETLFPIHLSQRTHFPLQIGDSDGTHGFMVLDRVIDVKWSWTIIETF
jgi:hypothetical protein